MSVADTCGFPPAGDWPPGGPVSQELSSVSSDASFVSGREYRCSVQRKNPQANSP